MNSDKKPSQEIESVTANIRALLTRHGIARPKHNVTIGNVLGFCYSHSARKMNGNPPWTVPELKKIAAYFKEPVGALIDPLKDSSQPNVILQDAVLMPSKEPIDCQIKIGPRVEGGAATQFVAVHKNARWQVYPSAHAPAGELFRVELIEVRSADSSLPTIAVLDDDRGSVDTMCEYLNEHGFIAAPFYTERKFREALQHRAYDAYIVDWLLGPTTALNSIKDIRASDNPSAPIILLTGQIRDGNAEVSDITYVMQSLGVAVVEKPARLPFLVVELSRKLRQQTAPLARDDVPSPPAAAARRNPKN